MCLHFKKRYCGFLTRHARRFRPCRPGSGLLSFSVRINKLGDEPLCRFVVVSPREMPSLAFSLFSHPFEISIGHF